MLLRSFRSVVSALEFVQTGFDTRTVERTIAGTWDRSRPRINRPQSCSQLAIPSTDAVDRCRTTTSNSKRSRFLFRCLAHSSVTSFNVPRALREFLESASARFGAHVYSYQAIIMEPLR